nr:hypothetical protein [Mucilaginibacter sp. SP1R1]
MDVSALLDSPIPRLDFSPEFKEVSIKMHVHTIREIIDTLPGDLLERSGFTYTWLGELSAFLMKYQSLHLLQPAGGKNYA